MFCTQNQLITEHAPVYPYEAVIRLKLTVSMRLTAVNITAINSQVWGLDGTGVLPVQPYRTNCNIWLQCAAPLFQKAKGAKGPEHYIINKSNLNTPLFYNARGRRSRALHLFT